MAENKGTDFLTGAEVEQEFPLKNTALRKSRVTGKLWGVTAPKFVKAGSQKVLYRRSTIESWLGQFEEVSVD